MRVLKNRGVVLAALLVCVSGTSGAAPIVMTFEGTVFNVADLEGRAAAAGLFQGVAISYTFLVDFESGGYLLENGVVEPYLDELTSNASREYFYAELLGGDLVDYGYYPDLVERIQFAGGNTIWFDDPVRPIYGELFGGKAVAIGSPLQVQDWTVGLEVDGQEIFANSNGFGFVYSDLVLTSRVAVPGPSAALLWAVGLGVVLARGRRTRPL